MSGSVSARSSTVFPMRPAAPTSKTRTGDSFIAAQFIRSSLRCPQRSSLDSLLYVAFCAEDSARYNTCELSLRFKIFQCFAQARLVGFAHLAQRQTNVRGHRA